MSNAVFVIALLGALQLAVLAAGESREVASGPHPISGVITMLEDLQVQAKEEATEEASTYQKYTHWCSVVKKDLSGTIAEHEDNIKILVDNIKGTKEDVKTIERNIKKLDKEITRRMAAQSRADDNRKEQAEDYVEEQSDLADTIDTLGKLVKAMEMLDESKDKTNERGSALLAKKAMSHALKLLQGAELSEEQQKGLEGVVQSMQKKLRSDATPKSNKVADHGMSGIRDLIKGMEVDFQNKQVESTKEETEAKNNYNLAKQAQDYAVSEAEGSKAEKLSILGDRKGDLAGHNADLDDEEALRDTEAANLKAHDATCATKAEEWDTRSKIREGEIQAMQMAVKILEKVTNVRNPDTYEKVERGAGSGPAAFLQLEDPTAKAVNLLKEVAKKRHSKSLAKLAEQVGKLSLKQKGPFDKMNQMIQKMIFRLMAEQKDEDDHKNWCDGELEKSTTSRDDKESKNELLSDKIATIKGVVAELTEAITENEEEVSAITAYVEEETEIRASNKNENEAAIKDAKDASKAVDEAIHVLTNFYKESGETVKKPWEFVQKTATGTAKRQSSRQVDLPEEPSTWDASYTGVANPDAQGEGVVAILTATGEKFATMEADVRASEESDEAAFQNDMTTQAADKAELQQDTRMKSNRRVALQQKQGSMETNQKHLATELDAVSRYLVDLQPACSDGDSSYADRKAARADEIAALRQAQTILDEAFKPEEGEKPDAGFMEKKKRQVKVKPSAPEDAENAD